MRAATLLLVPVALTSSLLAWHLRPRAAADTLAGRVVELERRAGVAGAEVELRSSRVRVLETRREEDGTRVELREVVREVVAATRTDAQGRFELSVARAALALAASGEAWIVASAPPGWIVDDPRRALGAVGELVFVARPSAADEPSGAGDEQHEERDARGAALDAGRAPAALDPGGDDLDASGGDAQRATGARASLPTEPAFVGTASVPVDVPKLQGVRRGRVRGRLLDGGSGEPIAGVELRLRCSLAELVAPDESQVLAETTVTDADGRFATETPFPAGEVLAEGRAGELYLLLDDPLHVHTALEPEPREWTLRTLVGPSYVLRIHGAGSIRAADWEARLVEQGPRDRRKWSWQPLSGTDELRARFPVAQYPPDPEYRPSLEVRSRDGAWTGATPVRTTDGAEPAWLDVRARPVADAEAGVLVARGDEPLPVSRLRPMRGRSEQRSLEPAVFQSPAPGARETAREERARTPPASDRGADTLDNRGADTLDNRGADTLDNRGADALDNRGAAAPRDQGADAPDAAVAPAPVAAPARTRTELLRGRVLAGDDAVAGLVIALAGAGDGAAQDDVLVTDAEGRFASSVAFAPGRVRVRAHDGEGQVELERVELEHRTDGEPIEWVLRPVSGRARATTAPPAREPSARGAVAAAAPALATLHGRIVAEGDALAGVEVALARAGAEPGAELGSALSDARGGYRFEGLAPGALRVVVRAPAHAPLERLVDARAGDNRLADLELARAGPAIRGALLCARGSAVPLAVLCLRARGAQGPARYRVVGADARSSFDFAGLAPGEYELAVLPPYDGAFQPVSLRLAPSDEACDFFMPNCPPARAFALRVLDATTRAPLERCVVQADTDALWCAQRAAGPGAPALVLLLPSGARFTWHARAQGYRPAFGDQGDFAGGAEEGADGALEVLLEPGFGGVYRFAEGASASATLVRAHRAVAGVALFADGERVATSGSDGVVSLSLRAAPRELRVEKPGWRLAADEPWWDAAAVALERE